MNALSFLVFLAAVGVSFLLSGMEAGVFALNRLRIRHWMREGNHRAARLHSYLEKPENFLWTILVGNTLSNLVAVSIGVLWLHRWLRGLPWLLLAALTAGILLFYAVCELLPKMLFRLYPNRLCMGLSGPFGLLHGVLRPVVAPVALFARWLLRWTGGRRFTGNLLGNRDELRVLMRESAQGLSSEERTLIGRVLDLQNLTVRQLTTPFSRAVTVTADTPLADVLSLVRERGHTRLPVWRRDRRRIAGVLAARPLLYDGVAEARKTAGDFVKPALYLDDDLRLEVALRMMQRSGHRMAIVLGPDRTETGIVGLQDILRVIFGDVKL